MRWKDAYEWWVHDITRAIMVYLKALYHNSPGQTQGNHKKKTSGQLVTVIKYAKIHYIRRCIQKFPDWVDNETYAYNNNHAEKQD